MHMYINLCGSTAVLSMILLRTLLGGMPRPVHTLPTLGFDEVTYGYVPKSMSNIVAFAPSTRMRLPESKASLVKDIVSSVMPTICKKEQERKFRSLSGLYYKKICPRLNKKQHCYTVGEMLRVRFLSVVFFLSRAT